MKKLLFLFVIVLAGCQTKEPENLLSSQEQPEITVTIDNEQLKTNTRIYCWNDCENGGDMGTINLPELTEGMDVVSVSPNTEVKVNVNGSDIPTTIGYYKQQESDIVQKSIQNNAFEIYGQQGVQHYLVVVDWYDKNGDELLGRAATPLVVKINE